MNSFREITIADPVAGTDFTYLQPANLHSKIVLVRFLFTASAVVGNRTIFLAYNSPAGGAAFNYCPFTEVCAASVARTYIAVDQSSQPEVVLTVGAASVVVREMGGFWIMPGNTFLSVVQNLKAGDQFSIIRVLFEDFNLVAAGVTA